MGCGCGQASNEKFVVSLGDGTVKTFPSKPEAEAFAVKNGGGMVKRA